MSLGQYIKLHVSEKIIQDMVSLELFIKSLKDRWNHGLLFDHPLRKLYMKSSLAHRVSRLF
jgi:hypothetical protein